MTLQPNNEVEIPNTITFPQYQSKKVVGALKITSVQRVSPIDENSDYVIWFEEYPDDGVVVSPRWHDHFKPRPYWYLVQYEDGYLSVSPPETFDRNHELIPEHRTMSAEDILEDKAQRACDQVWITLSSISELTDEQFKTATEKTVWNLLKQQAPDNDIIGVSAKKDTDTGTWYCRVDVRMEETQPMITITVARHMLREHDEDVS